MAILNMKPVKAFLYQDHEAHLQVHMTAMKDPKITQIVGQNPQANMVMGAMMAHINEHLAFEYRKQIEEQLGVPMDIPDYEDGETIPEEMEVQISRMMALAAQKLLQKDTAEAQQQQAQQQAQDPLVQMQMQELDLKKQEVDIKKTKMQLDAAAKADQLEIEKERIAAQKEIAGMQVGAKVAKDKSDLAAKQQSEGLRIGVDVARNHAQMAQQQQQPNKPTKGE
jgi:multidrug efflux pump subunit AcrA (membrane-fusion protein)